MKIYFDENIPIDLAHGMQHLDRPLNKKGEIEIHYLPDIHSPGAKDNEWIPILGQERAVVITHDFNIHRKIAERELYLQHGLSLIVFNPPSKTGYSYWELVQQMVRRWEDVKKLNSPGEATICLPVYEPEK